MNEEIKSAYKFYLTGHDCIVYTGIGVLIKGMFKKELQFSMLVEPYGRQYRCIYLSSKIDFCRANY